MIADAGWLERLSWQRAAVAAAVALCIVIPGARLRALTLPGAIAAFVVGTLCFWLGGPAVGAALIAFFITGSLLSRMKTRAGALADRRTGKSHTRDATQVLANGGVAAACSLASAIFPTHAALWIAAAIGALAAAAGDTWSTEIGALSPSHPRSLRGWRRVKPGVSGAVSGYGIVASLFGGAAIGLAAALVDRGLGGIGWIAACGAAGLSGSLFDSALGAHCQGVFVCRECREITERRRHACGKPTALLRGLAWFDNDGVNAATTAFGALVAALIASAIAAFARA